MTFAVVKTERATGRRQVFGLGMTPARAALTVRLMGQVQPGHYVTAVDELDLPRAVA